MEVKKWHFTWERTSSKDSYDYETLRFNEDDTFEKIVKGKETKEENNKKNKEEKQKLIEKNIWEIQQKLSATGINSEQVIKLKPRAKE